VRAGWTSLSCRTGEAGAWVGQAAGLPGDFVTEAFEVTQPVAILTFWVDAGAAEPAVQLSEPGFGSAIRCQMCSGWGGRRRR
jgi:hypothetical protein